MQYNYNLLLSFDGLESSIINPLPEQRTYIDEIVPEQDKLEFNQFVGELNQKAFHLDRNRITLLQDSIIKYIRSNRHKLSLRVEIKNFGITVKEADTDN